MNLMQKREALKGVYPTSPLWKDKVVKMSDTQVTAVYLRLKKQGKV